MSLVVWVAHWSPAFQEEGGRRVRARGDAAIEAEVGVMRGKGHEPRGVEPLRAGTEEKASRSSIPQTPHPGDPKTLAPDCRVLSACCSQSGSVIYHSSRDSPPPGEELGAGSHGCFRQERDSLIRASEIRARDGMATPGPARSMLTPFWAACGLVSGAPTALLAPPLHRRTD